MNKRAPGSTSRGFRNIADRIGSATGRENLPAEAAALLKADTGPVGGVKHGATQGVLGAVSAAAAHNTTDKQALFDQSVATLRKSIFEHSQQENTLESARMGFLAGFADSAAAVKSGNVVAKSNTRPKESPGQKARREMDQRLSASGLDAGPQTDDRYGMDR